MLALYVSLKNLGSFNTQFTLLTNSIIEVTVPGEIESRIELKEGLTPFYLPLRSCIVLAGESPVD